VGTVAVPLMHQDVIKQQPVHFLELERSYSDFMTNFIHTSAHYKQPFFLYYPSHVSHYMERLYIQYIYIYIYIYMLRAHVVMNGQLNIKSPEFGCYRVTE